MTKEISQTILETRLFGCYNGSQSLGMLVYLERKSGPAA